VKLGPEGSIADKGGDNETHQKRERSPHPFGERNDPKQASGPTSHTNKHGGGTTNGCSKSRSKKGCFGIQGGNSHSPKNKALSSRNGNACPKSPELRQSLVVKNIVTSRTTPQGGRSKRQLSEKNSRGLLLPFLEEGGGPYKDLGGKIS